MHEFFVTHGATSGTTLVDGHAFVDGALRTGDVLLADIESARALNRLADISGSWTAAFPHNDGFQLIADRVGSRPLYYRAAASAWHVSTDFWALVSTADRPVLEGRAVSDLLTYGYVLGTRTLLRDIYEVAPGTVTTLYPDGRVEHSRYWNFGARRPESFRLASEVDRFVETVNGMADRATVFLNRGAGGTGVTLNLTGGRDSRLVAWMLTSRGVPARGFTMQSGDDATVAERVAHALGIEHTIVPPWYEEAAAPDDGVVAALSPTTAFNVADGTLSVARHSQPPRLFVTGHVGGAPAGTLHDFRTLTLARLSRDAFTKLYVSKHTRLKPSRVAALLAPEYRHYAQCSSDALSRVAARWFTDLPALDAERQANFDNRQRRFIFRDFLAQRQLGSAFIPLLDNEWLDFWQTVPDIWFSGAPLYARATQELFGRENDMLASIPINGQLSATLGHPLRSTVIDLTGRIKRRSLRRPSSGSPDMVSFPDIDLDFLDGHSASASWRELPRETRYAIVTLSAFVERVRRTTGNKPAPPAAQPVRNAE